MQGLIWRKSTAFNTLGEKINGDNWGVPTITTIAHLKM